MTLGNPAAGGGFYYDPCHRHYHFKGYANYRSPLHHHCPLLTITSFPEQCSRISSRRLYSYNRTLTRVGRKQAFCLEDFEPISGWTGTP